MYCEKPEITTLPLKHFLTEGNLPGENSMGKIFLARVQELCNGVSIHSGTKSHNMKLKQFADFFQEFFSLWSDFGVVPGKNMCMSVTILIHFHSKVSPQVNKRSIIQKQFCRIVCFLEKFILKIADLLSFATEICFDFRFCGGRGKRFQVLTQRHTASQSENE